jgi:hypothetical protein
MPTFFPIAQQPKEVDEIKIEAITLRHNGLKLGMSLHLHCDGVWSDCTYVLFTTIALVSSPICGGALTGGVTPKV